MAGQKVYTQETEALIRRLANEGKTSTVIGEAIGKHRAAVISFCKRATPPIVLRGSSGAQPRDKNAAKRPRSPSAPRMPTRTQLLRIEDEKPPVFAQCQWPEACTELRETHKRPYCRAHNELAFLKSIPKGTAKPVGYAWIKKGVAPIKN